MRPKSPHLASSGAIAVLHTLGQNLMPHPHVHMIVPRGAWNKAEKRFRQRVVTRKKDGKVTVKLKNYRKGCKMEVMEIPVDDFFYEYQRLQLLGVEQVGAVSENCHGEISMKIVDEDGNVLTIVAQQWI